MRPSEDETIDKQIVPKKTTVILRLLSYKEGQIMVFTKPEFNCKQALKLALAGTGALLFLAPSVGAVQLTEKSAEKVAFTSQQPASQTLSTSHSMELAQTEVGCHRDESTFVAAETKNYLVYICGGDNPHTYVGYAKNGRGGITVPLTSYNRNVFTAKNGPYTYTVDMSKSQLVIKLPNGRRSIEKLINSLE
ncbi:hypothetical protein [Coleofasciculus sp. FACHB-T130]|uniref:hypothetical protein n=1 Tax=Cyanophyceae TaxID=3028117 RepID=UPI0016897B50|nr:hypothetical protein [Coleofasciculus sp. FACHB-T130]MBD1879090.1 hypothetical protein [Coleofasciculus sp. FACHB-T130]